MDISQFNQTANIIPGAGAFSITPGTTFTKPIRALYVGGGGNVNCTFSDGSTVILQGLVSGLLYPFQLTAIASGSTTATNLIGIY